MTLGKGLRIAAIVVGLLIASYFLRSTIDSFASITFLGGLLFLEILIVCLWKYEQWFFLLVVIAFVWAGVGFPLHAAWTSARWAVLATGALAGLIVWIRKPHARFSAFHVAALVCGGSALVSASISPIPQMSALKALSLCLLFLYGATGARAAVFGREERFFGGLLLGCEVIVYASTVAYLGIGSRFWGNSNSLGAAMSIGAFPILLWGWFTSEPGIARWRRLIALFLSTCLSFFSLARAGMVAMVAVALAFCFCLRQFKLLMKLALFSVGLVAVVGIVNPASLTESVNSVQDVVFYKGHKEQGVLGSRLSPWEKTVSNIKQHPWFGTGFGTSLTEEANVTEFGTYSSTSVTAREHGSSYMTIIEWVGLLGALPFVVLTGFNVMHVLRVARWMRREGRATHYSVPFAMVLCAGLIHAGFEDWMFAAGSYLCVYFWACAFALTDLVSVSASVPSQRVIGRVPATLLTHIEAAAPGR